MVADLVSPDPDLAPGPEAVGPLASDPTFALHAAGKLRVASTVPLRDADDLSKAYTPGVARVCEAIAADPMLAASYTWTSNAVAVVTDGTAVLGLGDIGPAAAMPVMEGKAVLFREFGGVDAIPICLDTTDPDEIVETVARLAPSFGGINLEDISAPRCFEIERRLQDRLDIPVFHDDQHGTAIVVLAALRNALRLTGRALGESRVVISGAGAAGVAVARILLAAGVRHLAVVDRGGVLHSSRTDLNPVKLRLAEQIASGGVGGQLVDALDGADVFIGVSGGQVPEAAVARMASDAIVFALANPTPEVHPDIARRYARVVATGRSDYPNQINNVLAFPGVFRGALDVGARRISEGMKLAAAQALADLVDAGPGAGVEAGVRAGVRVGAGTGAGPGVGALRGLDASRVIPSPFDPRVAPAVAEAVANAARAEGLAIR